jgi:hypothetical protein
MVSDGALRLTFETISQEKYAQAVNRKPYLLYSITFQFMKVKGKAVPVTGRGGP